MEDGGSGATAGSASTSHKRPHMPDDESEVQGGEASGCMGINRDEEGAEERQRAMAADEELEVSDLLHLRLVMNAAKGGAARVHRTDTFNQWDPRMVSKAVSYIRGPLTNLATRRRCARWRAERALRIAYQATETPRKVAKTKANTSTMPRQEPDGLSTSDSDSSEDD